MNAKSSLDRMLGSDRKLKGKPKTGTDWHELLTRGLPLRALERFKRATALSDTRLAALVGVSDKTLQRARGASRRLDPVTSDRLFRAASLVALAGEVLESNERGIAWLSRAQIGLGGRVPFDLMTTEAGAEQVEQLLLRIEHGVYS
jgi:putative toxin-antitoxin system antitoxin component (TIGR02293 family)